MVHLLRLGRRWIDLPSWKRLKILTQGRKRHRMERSRWKRPEREKPKDYITINTKKNTILKFLNVKLDRAELDDEDAGAEVPPRYEVEKVGTVQFPLVSTLEALLPPVVLSLT